MTNTYILVPGSAPTGGLMPIAAQFGGTTTLVVIGDRSQAEAAAESGADRVVWFPTGSDEPAEAFASAVARLVASEPGPVLAGRDPASRVLLGAAAAALGAPVIVGAREVNAVADGYRVTAEVFGGIALRTTEVDGPVALLVDGGATVDGCPPAPVIEQPVVGLPIAQLSLQVDKGAVAHLGSAARVVAVGRGLRSQDDLSLVKELATALGAELGCTRPLAEGLDWLGRDRYIGISGQQIAPELYLALGISGQLQHIAGARRADVIVAVNIDEKAPIVAEADYLLVGDLYDVVPALTSAMGATP